MLRIKQALDENRLGKLMLCDAIVKWYRAPEYYADSWHGTQALDGGGALINQAIHTVDLLRWLVGPVETAFMKGALRYPQIEGEDTLVSSLRFQNGALGVIQATTSSSPASSAASNSAASVARSSWMATRLASGRLMAKRLRPATMRNSPTVGQPGSHLE